MKKSKILPLILLLVLALALFFAYKVMIGTQESGTPSASTGDEVTMILDRISDDVRALRYTAGGETLSFTHAASSADWVLEDQPVFPLDQTTVASMASAISTIGVYRTLDTGDTGAYGFDAPACTVYVRYSDGEEHSYAIGALNSVTGNRYFKDLDTGVVYMISPALLPYFQYSLSDLFVYDTLPTDIDVSYISAVTLGASVTEDAEKIEEIYNNFLRLTPTRYADWSGTEEAKAAYGIGADALSLSYKRAVSVTDTAGATITSRIPADYTVTFGTPDEEGRIPYCLSGSDVIYLADAAIYEAIAAVFG